MPSSTEVALGIVYPEAVRTNDPGNHLGELFKSRLQSDTYMLVEIYKDEAALAAHQNRATWLPIGH
ncbi:putative quinol monooxygenase [Rhizobium gallicum]|uniref:putative quinol monooxygenase n=1 Tax=Rhizobium gallicum TaxID=56730 RepID=UPI001F46668B|nr:antibiotic biosynthesis monooxygenase [Rhizobium gallicum]